MTEAACTFSPLFRPSSSGRFTSRVGSSCGVLRQLEATGLRGKILGRGQWGQGVAPHRLPRRVEILAGAKAAVDLSPTTEAWAARAYSERTCLVVQLASRAVWEREVLYRNNGDPFRLARTNITRSVEKWRRFSQGCRWV